MSARACVSLFSSLIAFVTLGCGGTMESAAPLVPAGADAYPHETLTDWVTYADAVVVFQVTAEREILPSEAEVEAGEGLIMRELEAKVLQRVWTADGASNVPSAFTFVSSGWSFQGRDRRPMASPGAGRLEVGGRYLGPLAPGSPYGTNGWYPMHHAETLHWVDGRARAGSAADEKADSTDRAIEEVAGLDADELADLLDRQVPDPVASKDRSLSPRERFRTLAQEPGTGG